MLLFSPRSCCRSAAVVVHGERSFIPNGTGYPNDAGVARHLQHDGRHRPDEPVLPEPRHQRPLVRVVPSAWRRDDGLCRAIQQRFDHTDGLDPIFRTNDGSNCNHDIDTSTLAGRRDAYSLLRTRGVFRIAIDVPPTADFAIVDVDNPYLCNETNPIAMYRRPLPSANLRFLSAVMFDGRESSPLTGTTKIGFGDSAALPADLAHQSMDATNTHAQGDGTRPTSAEKQQIVDFEMALFTAQTNARGGGNLDAQGRTGRARGARGRAVLHQHQLERQFPAAAAGAARRPRRARRRPLHAEGVRPLRRLGD